MSDYINHYPLDCSVDDNFLLLQISIKNKGNRLLNLILGPGLMLAFGVLPLLINTSLLAFLQNIYLVAFFWIYSLRVIVSICLSDKDNVLGNIKKGDYSLFVTYLANSYKLRTKFAKTLRILFDVVEVGAFAVFCYYREWSTFNTLLYMFVLIVSNVMSYSFATNLKQHSLAIAKDLDISYTQLYADTEEWADSH